MFLNSLNLYKGTKVEIMKINTKLHFNFSNILNKNIKSFSKHACSYFDGYIKNFDVFISEKQEWLSQRKDIKLNFDIPCVFNLNKNIKSLSKYAHSYFDVHIKNFDIPYILAIKTFSRDAHSYFDDYVKNIDSFISEKQEWFVEKRAEITNYIKQNDNLNVNKKIMVSKNVIFENKHLKSFLDKLEILNFIETYSKFSLSFFIKSIRKLLELIELSRLVTLFKRKLYSSYLSQTKVERAPPFIYS